MSAVRSHSPESAVNDTLRHLLARSTKLGDDLTELLAAQRQLLAAQDKLLLFLKKRRTKVGDKRVVRS